MSFHKNPRVRASAIIVLIILVGWLIFKKPDSQTTETQKALNGQISIPTTTSSGLTETKKNLPGSAWEGMLQSSDNASKGNLMLLTSTNKIYLRTNRDFSQFIGKAVMVSYVGDLDSFVLGEIVLK